MHNIMLWTLQDGLHILRTDDILVFPSMIIVCTDYTLFFFFFFFFFYQSFPYFNSRSISGFLLYSGIVLKCHLLWRNHRKKHH